jgi:DNA-binding LytR/AlgR family response regulator
MCRKPWHTTRGAPFLLGEIDWIEASGNYARLWIGGRSYLLRESLNVLEERVREHRFLRALRNALVRPNGIVELTYAQSPAGAAPRSLHV